MLQLFVTLQILKDGAVDRVRSLSDREDGAIAIEYALIAVVIALGLLLAAQGAQGRIATMLERITPW